MGNKNHARNSTLPTEPPIVHIIWQDTYSLDETWHPTTEPIERRLIRSIGFKINENDEYIVLAATYDPTAETYGNALAIHRPAILTIQPVS
jgi:hypothetical protein